MEAVAIIICLLPLSVAMVTSTSMPQYKTNFTLAKPAVLELAPMGVGKAGKPALLVTTFNGPFSKDPIYAVSDLASLSAGTAAANVTVIDDTMHWVNFVEPVPSGAVVGASERELLIAAGGFLVPTKTPGTVNILDVTDLAAVQNTKVSAKTRHNSGYFYHETRWADMNKDGRMDILAPRATQPLVFGKKGGELVWFEQPAEGALGSDGAWTEHIVCPGPDVSFLFTDLDGDGGLEEIVATQFFSSPELRVYWCEGKQSWADCGKDDIHSRVLDGEANGPWFNVEKVDLDNDGKDDLLVTSNRDDGHGALYAYEIPPDFRNGEWKSHTLATGYKPLKSGTGKGAPGTARSFHAEVASKGKAKPQILISGDDAGVVDILTPASNEAGNFEYTSERLTSSESSGTIGTPAFGDVDGDGWVEIFVPMYSDNRVEVYSFGAQ